MVQKETILVTGGAGYIGSHVVLALQEAGLRPVVIDDLSTGFRWAVPQDVPFYQGDIADRALLMRIFQEQGVHGVMHFAGSVVVPESVSDPLKYYWNNTVKSHALIAASIAFGIRRFVFSSTAAVYGIAKDVPVSEEAPLAPINPYGASKMMTERMLADVAFAHPFNYACLRYFNVAGADPKGRTGQSTQGATHLLKVAVEAALGKRDAVDIYGDDYPTADGTGVRDYIHVSDLAAVHVLALGALMAHPDDSMTLNCGYNHGFSVLEVLDAVDRVSGKPVKRHIKPRRAGDPAMLVADTRRIHQRLDWRPVHDDLDSIVADALAWEKRLGEIRKMCG